MIWTVYGALIAGGAAVSGAATYLGLRALAAWRSFKHLRHAIGRELERLADLGERASRSAESAADTAELRDSVERLRGSLAQLAILRAAFDEATAPVRSLVAFLRV